MPIEWVVLRRRKSQSTSTVLEPAKAEIRARPTAVVVLPSSGTAEVTASTFTLRSGLEKNTLARIERKPQIETELVASFEQMLARARSVALDAEGGNDRRARGARGRRRRRARARAGKRP